MLEFPCISVRRIACNLIYQRAASGVAPSAKLNIRCFLAGKAALGSRQDCCRANPSQEASIENDIVVLLPQLVLELHDSSIRKKPSSGVRVVLFTLMIS